MVNQLEVDMRRIVEKTRRKMETVILEFGQDIAERAVENTPVATGFLRGSWHVEVNSQGTTRVGAADPTGQSVLGEMSIALTAAEAGDTLYFLNGAKYAKFVEYGTSRMAPRAFVRKTINEAPRIADQTIARIGQR